MATWHVLQTQGTRPYMEDRYVIIPKFYNGFDLIAVFDGHGGKFVSDFCADNMARVLRSRLDALNGNIREALKQAFQDIDDQMPMAASISTGSTCLVILCNGEDTLWVANTGDSRAVMNKKERCVILSKDHKPDVPDEKRRIEQGGGFIAHHGVWRVLGELAVSRAIGDKRYRPLVIPTPDVKRIKIDPNETSHIIIATDGLWDVASNKDVNKVASANAGNMCKALMTFAGNHGLEDNTTIICGIISNS